MKTRAAVFYGPGRPLEVREIELEEPQDDEVVVRMVSVGICGTDIPPGPPPNGFELYGVGIEFGPRCGCDGLSSDQW